MFNSYIDYPATDLPSATEHILVGTSKRSCGKAGFLCYGPYQPFPSGAYTAGFDLICLNHRPVKGEIILDVSDSALGQLAKTSLTAHMLGTDVPLFMAVDFDLSRPAEKLEVRLHIAEGLIIQIDRMSIFRRNLA